MESKSRFNVGNEMPAIESRDPLFKRLALRTLEIVTLGLYTYRPEK